LARWSITTAIPYAGEGRPQDPSSFVNLRTEAGWKLRNRLDVTHFGFWNAECGTQIGFNPKSKIPNTKSLGATAAVPLLPWPVLCPAGRRAAAIDLRTGRQNDQTLAEGRVGDD